MKAIWDFGFGTRSPKAWRRRILDWIRRGAVAVVVFTVVAIPVSADSKADTMKPLGQGTADKEAIRAEVETEYRKALEGRLAEEKASYEGSLRSLWMSNAAVWTVLLLFIAMQALSAHKRDKELKRLRAAREAPADRP